MFGLVGIPARVPPPRPGGRAASRPAAGPGLGQLRLPRAPATSVPTRPGPRPTQRPKPRLINRGRRHEELDGALVGYGQARGWSPETLRRVRHSLVVLLASQPPLTSTSPLDAAVVRQFLIDRHLTALRVIEFLTDQGLVRGDEHATLDRWLARRLAPLPVRLRAEVQTWVEVLRGRGPRPGRPRKAATIQGYLRALEPALADWSARYQSLRQVTSDDITDQLQRLTGPTRLLVAAAIVAVQDPQDPPGELHQPHRRAGAAPPAATTGAWAGPDPPCRPARPTPPPDQRLIVLLAGVHALRPHQIRVLALDDVDLAAGTLVAGGPRRLDALTLAELGAWLSFAVPAGPPAPTPACWSTRAPPAGSPRSPAAMFSRCSVNWASPPRPARGPAAGRGPGHRWRPLKLTEFFGSATRPRSAIASELDPLDQRPVVVRWPVGGRTGGEPVATCGVGRDGSGTPRPGTLGASCASHFSRATIAAALVAGLAVLVLAGRLPPTTPSAQRPATPTRQASPPGRCGPIPLQTSPPRPFEGPCPDAIGHTLARATSLMRAGRPVRARPPSGISIAPPWWSPRSRSPESSNRLVAWSGSGPGPTCRPTTPHAGCVLALARPPRHIRSWPPIRHTTSSPWSWPCHPLEPGFAGDCGRLPRAHP